MTSGHVFFFKAEPDAVTAAEIERRFREFFRNSLSAYPGDPGSADVVSSFDPTGPCLEFEAPTPTDHGWPIATFQGGRFGW